MGQTPNRQLEAGRYFLPAGFAAGVFASFFGFLASFFGFEAPFAMIRSSALMDAKKGSDNFGENKGHAGLGPAISVKKILIVAFNDTQPQLSGLQLRQTTRFGAAAWLAIRCFNRLARRRSEFQSLDLFAAFGDLV